MICIVVGTVEAGEDASLYRDLLADATFHQLLLACDADLADAARAGRCGALHSACYPRKPRGRPCRLGPEHDRRFSFCCAVDGCRSRATPPSLHFLGRKVYLAAIVVLVAILRHGVTTSRMERLWQAVGVDRRIVERWRRWWREGLVRPNARGVSGRGRIGAMSNPVSNPFRYFNSSPEVIRLVVMMYVRYPLSLRNVEDLLAERGIDISHETVRFWWNRFGPMFAAEIRKRRAAQVRGFIQWRWHLDEAFVKINGKLRYLWRAVDHEGEVLEAVVTARRNKAAALKLLKRIMKKYGRPRTIVTDELRAYSAAMREVGNAGRQEVGGRRSAQQSRGEFTSAVSTTRESHAAVSKHEDVAEVQFSSRPGPQLFQSRAPSRHEASLQAKTLGRVGGVARARGVDRRLRAGTSRYAQTTAVTLTKPARAWLSPTIAFGQAHRHELLPHKYAKIHFAALEGLVLGRECRCSVSDSSGWSRAHLSNLVAKKTFSIVSWPILARVWRLRVDDLPALSGQGGHPRRRGHACREGRRRLCLWPASHCLWRCDQPGRACALDGRGRFGPPDPD